MDPTRDPIVTECDLKKERLVREKLLEFAESLENNLRLIKNLLTSEQSNVDQIRIKSIRYELLTRSCPGAAAPYPEDLVEEVKRECVEEIVRRLQSAGTLVSDTVGAFNRILRSFQALEKAAYRCDWAQRSELIEGSKLRLMTVELVETFNGIDAKRAGTVEMFRGCLKIPEDFEKYVEEFVGEQKGLE
ncbi:hypothetical protein pipiens_012383 [Culex pipiens pipiens]|uniref:Uncharacterized protein n=1 Tax=Culex pipiens pipiens TaxID=38569 RepID=A0ABD1D2L5_CULPP